MLLNTWRRKYQKLQRKYFGRNATIKKLNNKRSNKKKVFIEKEIEKCTFIADDVKMFVKMQVTQRTSFEKWSMENKILAQSLYYKSPAYYTFLRAMEFVLPSPSSINRWLPIKSFLPGLGNKEAIYNLNIQLSGFEDNMKFACITFDEMRCRSELEYNDKHDNIDSVADDGTKRSAIIADHICCFMIRGIFSNWKFVLGYITSGGPTKNSELKTHLLNAIDMATNMGLNGIAVTCDQGTNNQSLYKKMF